jgi:hypothetical protein
MNNWIDIREANKKFKELQSQLTDKQLALSVSRAINRTLMKGRTEARKAVKEAYNIPQRNLSGINYAKATSATLNGNVYAGSRPIPLNAFAPKFETQSRSITTTKRGEQKIKDRKKKVSNPGKGVSVEIIKGKRAVVPFAFMIAGGKPHVFARGEYKSGGSFGFVRRHKRVNKEGSDIPVKPLISVSVHGAATSPNAVNKVITRMVNEYPKEFEHELIQRVSKLSR